MARKRKMAAVRRASMLLFAPLALLFVPPRRAAAQAPAPLLEEVSPPGGVPGATVRVTLAGKHLEGLTALLFDGAGFQAAPYIPPAAAPNNAKQSGARATAVWDVTIDASVPPGFHDVRAVSALGVSAPRAFHVSPVPLLTDGDPRDGAPPPGDALADVLDDVFEDGEVRIAGLIEEGEADRFRWKADRDGRVVVECFAERIDSMLDATLEVREESGRRVGLSLDHFSLDPALAFEARASAVYTIDLWDFTYRGRSPYLLSISRSPRVLFAFPPVLSGDAPAAAATVTLYGWNLPGGVIVPGDRRLLESIAVEASSFRPPAGQFRAYRRTCDLLGGLVETSLEALPLERIVLLRSTEPFVLELEPNDRPESAMALTLPCGLSGRFDAPMDRDWFSFRAVKGEPIEIEVFSARLGAPTDPLLFLGRIEAPKKEAAEGRGAVRTRDILFLDGRKGGFSENDSFERKFVAPSRDPVAVWTPPEDGEYVLELRNRNRQGGLAALYHLVLRPPAPSFTLVATHGENVSGEAAMVQRGGSSWVDVLVERRGGFRGAVRITAEGLPPGVSSPPVFAGPDDAFASLVFTASPDAAPWTGTVEVAGAGEWAGKAIRSVASSSVMVFGGTERRHPLQRIHSRIARSLPMAVRDPAAFSVTIDPVEETASRGTKVHFTARVSRREGFTEPIALSFQGLGEEAYPDDQGNRPSKVTIERGETEKAFDVTVKKDMPFGEHTFLVFATAQVEYLEDPGDPKTKKERKRTTLASNPATVHLESLFRVGKPEMARAGALRIEIERSAALASGEDLRLRVRVAAPGGKEQRAEVLFGPAERSKGILLDTGELTAGDGKGRLFPLRVRLTAALPGGDLNEEYLVESSAGE